MPMKKVSTGFGLRLKQVRESRGLTQDQLAEAAGLNKNGLAKLEQGVSEPHWPTVLALAAALGVNCLEFQAPPAAGVKPRGRGRPPKAEGEPGPRKGKGKQ